MCLEREERKACKTRNRICFEESNERCNGTKEGRLCSVRISDGRGARI